MYRRITLRHQLWYQWRNLAWSLINRINFSCLYQCSKNIINADRHASVCVYVIKYLSFCVECPIHSNAIRFVLYGWILLLLLSICESDGWFHFPRNRYGATCISSGQKFKILTFAKYKHAAMFSILSEYIVHCQGRSGIKFRNIHIHFALQLIAYERASWKLNRVPLLFSRDGVNTKTNAYISQSKLSKQTWEYRWMQQQARIHNTIMKYSNSFFIRNVVAIQHSAINFRKDTQRAPFQANPRESFQHIRAEWIHPFAANQIVYSIQNNGRHTPRLGQKWKIIGFLEFSVGSCVERGKRIESFEIAQQKISSTCAINSNHIWCRQNKS